MPSTDDSVAWIPCRVLSMTADRAISQHVADSILRPGLLPVKQDAAESARQWTALFMSASPKVGIIQYIILELVCIIAACAQKGDCYCTIAYGSACCPADNARASGEVAWHILADISGCAYIPAASPAG